MKYKIGDWFVYKHDSSGEKAHITGISSDGKLYVYDIYNKRGVVKHSVCDFKTVEDVTRKLTKLEKALK